MIEIINEIENIKASIEEKTQEEETNEETDEQVTKSAALKGQVGVTKSESDLYTEMGVDRFGRPT
ncbi:MAG: hypothetical protein H5T45_06025, partial [Thermoplasmatales archaeon]|nr:hypothetical protein [Thermoplasmatales archaeon]